MVAVLINDLSEKRFWGKINITDDGDDCWEWEASVDHRGYGQFWLNGEVVRAHRTAWILLFGDIPEGLMVLHKCHIRRCCNPSHLKLGTAQDNTDDMMKAGRHVSGFVNMTSEQKRLAQKASVAVRRQNDILGDMYA